MPVTFWPPSLTLICNETVVLVHQCLIPSFVLVLKSTAFFSNINVTMNASSMMLTFDKSIFTLAFRPLCGPGSFVVQSSSNSSGICSNCSNTGFSNVSDALVCSICPAGSVPMNRTVCMDCSANTYANQSGSSECLSCPSNHYAAPSRKECLSFQFMEIPPTAIASNTDIQLPCVRLSSNNGGIVNLTISQEITVRIIILPVEVQGVKVMADDVKVTLLSNGFACQRSSVKVNSNVVESLFGTKYSWAFQIYNCNSSFCSFASPNDEKFVLPYNVSVRSSAR
jgi:hypothetical protein